MKYIPYLFLLIALIGETSKLLALPIGFGIPQGERDYHQTTDSNFLIYHDARTPHEALMILDSLATVKPILDRWFAISRTRPLPVITSALTNRPSFANFITDALELQTLGQGQRDLFWHEYVHNMMYLHLKNFMGPAGTVFHLPWMPAWFIEGLAEALAISLRSERQATIERKQALTKSWPTYDRLHSLYSSSRFYEQGYASSGAFVSWILRKGYAVDKNFLPKLLQRFYKYTLPQYYPATATPISDMLPMDEALRDFLGKKGRGLYEDYKQEAEAYWRQNKKTTLLNIVDSKNAFNEFPQLKVYDGQIFSISNHYPEEGIQKRIIFDEASGEIKETKKQIRSFENDIFEISIFGSLDMALRTRPALKNGIPIYQIVHLSKNQRSFSVDAVMIEREGQISNLSESRDKIYWKETVYEVTRLCFVDKEKINKLTFSISSKEVSCPVSVTLPKRLNVLGVENEKLNKELFDKKVWYSVELGTLKNTHYEVWEWDVGIGLTSLKWQKGANPLSIAKTTDEMWALISERTHRSLMKIKPNGVCLGLLSLDDDVSAIHGVNEGLVLVFSRTDDFIVKKFQTKDFKLESCRTPSDHSSPLTYVMSHTEASLEKALESSSIWAKDTETILTDAVPLGAKSKKIKTENKKAQWRPRPVFALPWIGANDALGYQLGALSVPLMDQMQNETVFLTVLYGVASHYPNTELTMYSSRYWPQLSLSAYRRQLWNGSYETKDGYTEHGYIDDKGVRMGTSLNFYTKSVTTVLGGGFLVSRRDPYRGPTTVGSKAHLMQAYLGTMFTGDIKNWTWNLKVEGLLAPGSMNSQLEYHSLNASFTLARPMKFLSSNFGVLLESGLTRGRSGKTPVVRQIYIPMKTFIPGTNSTYNQNSYPFIGNGKLMRAELGDNKAKAELSWNFPLIKDWDKLKWILYFYELRFSHFLNYGGAWYQNEPVRNRMLLAHSYMVDMLFENKGVKFNLGLGVGHAAPGPGQIFIDFGFNMFF